MFQLTDSYFGALVFLMAHPTYSPPPPQKEFPSFNLLQLIGNAVIFPFQCRYATLIFLFLELFFFDFSCSPLNFCCLFRLSHAFTTFPYTDVPPIADLRLGFGHSFFFPFGGTPLFRYTVPPLMRLALIPLVSLSKRFPLAGNSLLAIFFLLDFFFPRTLF